MVLAQKTLFNVNRTAKNIRKHIECFLQAALKNFFLLKLPALNKV